MPSPPARFAIKSPSGFFLSDHEILGSVLVMEKDAVGNVTAQPRHVVKPIFKGNEDSACKYDSEADALAAMSMPHQSQIQDAAPGQARLSEKDAFVGCVAVQL